MCPSLHKLLTNRMALFQKYTVALGQNSLFNTCTQHKVAEAQVFQVQNWSSAFHEQLQPLQTQGSVDLSLLLIATTMPIFSNR